MVIICQLWQTPPSCHKSSQKPPWSPGPVCTPWNQSSPIRTSYLDGGDEVKVLEFVILNKILGGWWVGVIMITVTKDENEENDNTSQETLVWDMYQSRTWDFSPQGDCFRKQCETELGGGTWSVLSFKIFDLFTIIYNTYFWGVKVILWRRIGRKWKEFQFK